MRPGRAPTRICFRALSVGRAHRAALGLAELQRWNWVVRQCVGNVDAARIFPRPAAHYCAGARSIRDQSGRAGRCLADRLGDADAVALLQLRRARGPAAARRRSRAGRRPASRCRASAGRRRTTPRSFAHPSCKHRAGRPAWRSRSADAWPHPKAMLRSSQSAERRRRSSLVSTASDHLAAACFMARANRLAGRRVPQPHRAVRGPGEDPLSSRVNAAPSTGPACFMSGPICSPLARVPQPHPACRPTRTGCGCSSRVRTKSNGSSSAAHLCAAWPGRSRGRSRRSRTAGPVGRRR